MFWEPSTPLPYGYRSFQVMLEQHDKAHKGKRANRISDHPIGHLLFLRNLEQAGCVLIY